MVGPLRKRRKLQETVSHRIRHGRVTRSWAAALRPVGQSTASGSHVEDAVDLRYAMILQNMVGTEALEHQLISAITENTSIQTPDVELLDEKEYNQLYKVVYKEMPKDLIKWVAPVVKKRGKKSGRGKKIGKGMKERYAPVVKQRRRKSGSGRKRRNALVTKPVSIKLPPVSVKVEKLDFSKWKGNCSRFKIRRTGKNYYHVAPIANPDGKVLRIRK